MKTILILLISFIAFVTLTSESCDDYGKSVAGDEQKLTEQNQEILLRIQPPVKLKWSLEREMINKRTTLWNDENKVAYIYLIDYGKIMAFFSIKGKVSSVNSQITNPEQIIKGSSQNYGMLSIPSPAEDGSYGTNGDAIFFFTTDGTYVEWAGSYMLCDKPLKLSSPPQLVKTIN
jgi:hypothetical protein